MSRLSSDQQPTNCIWIPLWLLSPLHWSELCRLPCWLVSLQDFSSYRVVADLGGGYGRLLMDIMGAYSGQPPPLICTHILSWSTVCCPGRLLVLLCSAAAKDSTLFACSQQRNVQTETGALSERV